MHKEKKSIPCLDKCAFMLEVGKMYTNVEGM